MLVTRTFAFIDLCGFTPYIEASGEARAGEALARLRTALRHCAELHGVRLVKWLGGGAMLCGSDLRGVVRCVVSVRDAMAADSPLPLRAGIAVGRALMFEGDDYIGVVVHVAARLCARAKPQQILATVNVADVVSGGVTLRPLQPVRLHGMAPIEVRELAGPRGASRDAGWAPWLTA